MSTLLALNKTNAIEALAPLIEQYKITIEGADQTYNRNLNAGPIEHAFDAIRLIAALAIIIQSQQRDIENLRDSIDSINHANKQFDHEGCDDSGCVRNAFVDSSIKRARGV